MYENKIVIENVSIEKNRINYHYTISGEWLDCFKEDEQFYIEYSIDVSSIPISIAVVPLLNIENLGKECLLKRAIRRLKRLLK